MTALQRVEAFLIAWIAAMRLLDLLRIVFGHFFLREQEHDLSPELRDELARSPLLPPIAVRGEGAGLRYPNIERDVSKADLVCIVDGDAIPERDALLFAVKPFLEDSSTIAVTGMTRVAPGGWLARFEAMENLRELLTSRLASPFLLSDRRAPSSERVTFVAETLCTIPGARRVRDMRARIIRRQRDVTRRIRRSPWLLVPEAIGPVVELLGYELTLFGLAFALIPAGMAIEFAIVSIGFGAINSMMAAALEAPELLGVAIVEWLGFRELATIWRTRGVIDGLL